MDTSAAGPAPGARSLSYLLIIKALVLEGKRDSKLSPSRFFGMAAGPIWVRFVILLFARQRRRSRLALHGSAERFYGEINLTRIAIAGNSLGERSEISGMSGERLRRIERPPHEVIPK